MIVGPKDIIFIFLLTCWEAVKRIWYITLPLLIILCLLFWEYILRPMLLGV